MPGLRLAASRGKPKKTAPDDWLGSAQPEEEAQELEPDPLFDMANQAPSAAAVQVHEPPPTFKQSADVDQMRDMIAQLQAQVHAQGAQVHANTTSRLMQTPQGTLALTPYQVRFSCESCVKTIT